MELREMAQANLDLHVLQETNLTNGIYTCESFGYRVVTAYVPSRHYDRVAVFYCVSPGFSVEMI